MRKLNITLFVLFSLLGLISFREDLAADMFANWAAVYSIFPLSLLGGVLVLGSSLLNSPVKTWGNFDLNKFLFNPHQPHIFIASIGSIFFTGGVLAVALSFASGLPVQKHSGLLVLTGLGSALPAIIVCVWLSRKKDA